MEVRTPWVLCVVRSFYYVGLEQTTNAAIQPTTPTNVTVSAGMTITFGCETDSGSRIRWNFDRSNSSFPFTLYNGYSVVASDSWRIYANLTVRRNEITIKNVGIDYFGVYSCHELTAFSRKVDFHLLVKGMSFCPILYQLKLIITWQCSQEHRESVQCNSLYQTVYWPHFDVSNHVTFRFAIYHFILVLRKRVSVSDGFKIFYPNMYGSRPWPFRITWRHPHVTIR